MALRQRPPRRYAERAAHDGWLARDLAVLLALLWIGREAGGYVPQFAAWVDELGPWGSAAFVIGYAVAVVAFVPGSLLTLAAGAIFGAEDRNRCTVGRGGCHAQNRRDRVSRPAGGCADRRL